MNLARAGYTAAASLVLLTVSVGRAQITSVPATPAAFALGAERQVGSIRIVPVRGNVYLFAAEEGNSTVQIGPDGVLVVDPFSPALVPDLLEALRTLTPRPILQIINTNVDRTGGNGAIRTAGRDLDGFVRGDGAPILAFEEVLGRLARDNDAASTGGLPTHTYFVASKDLFFNSEPVQAIHQPAAYSDGDSLVFFRRSDVISAGDVFVPQRYPRFDLGKGGSLNGVVLALNQIIGLTVPELNEEGGTMVVPAVGRLTDEADVAEYRDMVTIVRDRIQDMIGKGMSLEQVLAARPTRDYDPVYSTPQYTGDMFVENAYRSLTAAVQTQKESGR